MSKAGVPEQYSGISKADLEELRKRGYEPIEIEGKGHTRTAWKMHKSLPGDNNMEVTVIIPSELDLSSFTTVNNFSKGDKNLEEIKALVGLDHPNIVKLYDALEGEKGTITVQEHVHGENLKEYSQNHQVTPDTFSNILRQSAEGTRYLNEDKRILHRDIKPDNILITKEGRVKIADFQNATSLEGAISECLHTKGGTSYTRPKILNKIMKQEKARLRKEDEAYALAATSLELINGKPPLNYSLKLGKKGQEMVMDNLSPKIINSKDFMKHVQLLVDGEPVPRITPEMHNRKIDKSIELMPKEFRFYKDFFDEGLKTYRGFNDTMHLLESLDKAEGGFQKWASDKWNKYSQSVVSTTTGVVATALIAWGMTFLPDQHIETYEGKSNPLRLKKIMNPSSIVNIGAELKSRYHPMDILKDYISEIKSEYSTKGKEWAPISFVEENEEKINNLANRKNISKRLFVSYLRASLDEDISLQNRETKYNLPKGWNYDSGPPVVSYPDKLESVADYIDFISRRNHTSVDRIVADLVTDDKEQWFAQRNSKNVNLFATLDSTGTTHSGSGRYLSTKANKFANTILAWYLMSDEQGSFQPESELDDIN